MSASGREKDFESAEAMRRRSEAELPERVRRLHRQGLADSRIAAQLHISYWKAKALREALGLPANTGGAS